MGKSQRDYRPHVFWSRVDKSGECWLWTAGLFKKDGYGQYPVKVDGAWTSVGAHKVAWVLCNGDVPDSMQVLHKCDVRACVRPDHLFIGTVADNMRDKCEKGRASCLRGETNPMSVLTWESVRLMREGRAEGRSLLALAEEFGVAFQTVSKIVRGERWVEE